MSQSLDNSHGAFSEAATSSASPSGSSSPSCSSCGMPYGSCLSGYHNPDDEPCRISDDEYTLSEDVAESDFSSADSTYPPGTVWTGLDHSHFVGGTYDPTLFDEVHYQFSQNTPDGSSVWDLVPRAEQSPTHSFCSEPFGSELSAYIFHREVSDQLKFHILERSRDACRRLGIRFVEYEARDVHGMPFTKLVPFLRTKDIQLFENHGFQPEPEFTADWRPDGDLFVEEAHGDLLQELLEEPLNVPVDQPVPYIPDVSMFAQLHYKGQAFQDRPFYPFSGKPVCFAPVNPRTTEDLSEEMKAWRANYHKILFADQVVEKPHGDVDDDSLTPDLDAKVATISAASERKRTAAPVYLSELDPRWQTETGPRPKLTPLEELTQHGLEDEIPNAFCENIPKTETDGPLHLLRRVFNYVKSFGPKIADVFSTIFTPVKNFFLDAIVQSIWTSIKNNFMPIIMILAAFLVPFILKWFGLPTAGCVALGAIFAGFTASKFTGTTNDQILAYLQHLDMNEFSVWAAHSSDDEEPEFGFNWFQSICSMAGFRFFHFAGKVSKAWNGIACMRSFAAFIFEMMPMFFREAILHAYPELASAILWGNCGWPQLSNEMELILKQAAVRMTAEHKIQFEEVAKRAKSYLSTNLAKPWYDKAKRDFDSINLRYRDLLAKFNIASGITPFVVHIGGAHGLGKTDLGKIVSNMLASLAVGHLTTSGVYRKPSGAYFERYEQEPVIFIPDILGGVNSSVVEDCDMMIGLYDAPYKPNVAAVEGKGVVVYPQAVVAATNFLHPRTIPDFNNLRSYLRKRNLCVEALPVDQALFQSNDWPRYLSAMSPADKQNFKAMKYIFHPIMQPLVQLDHARFVDADRSVHFGQELTVKELLRVIRAEFLAFRARRPAENEAIQGLLAETLKFDVANWEAMPQNKPSEKSLDEQASLVKKILVALAVLTPIASLIAFFLYKDVKRHHDFTTSVDAPHSSGQSKPRGKYILKQSKGRVTVSPDIEATAAHGSQTVDQFEKIQKQIVQVKFGNTLIHGLCIGGDYLLTVAHVFKVGNDYPERQFEVITRDGIVYTQILDPAHIRVRRGIDSDAHLTYDHIVIKLSSVIRGMSNLVSKFEDVLVTPSSVYHLYQNSQKLVPVELRCDQNIRYAAKLSALSNLVLDRPIGYTYESKSGECGLPICTEYEGRLIILGIHTGATATRSWMTTVLAKHLPAKPLSIMDVREAHGMASVDFERKTEIPEGNYSNIGYNSRPVMTPMTTKLARTDFPDPGTQAISKKSPRILRTREKRFGPQHTKCIPRKAHEYAIAVVRNLYTRHADENTDRRVLTPQEAVDALEADTSVGYPWIMSRSQLAPKSTPGCPKTMDDWNADFRKEFEKVWNAIKAGEFPPAIVTPCLKDETLSLEKIAIEKTRTFHISSFIWTIIGKMYQHTYMEYMKVNTNRIPSAIGIDVNSGDYHVMIQKLVDFSHCFVAADISAFETTVTGDNAQVYLACMDAFYQDEGSVNAHARRAYEYAMLSPAVVAGNSVWARGSGNPSGRIGTAQLNCHVLSYYWAAAYKMCFPNADLMNFEFEVCHKCLGDDFIATIKPAIVDRFNMMFVADFMASIGITMTDGAKTGEMKPYYDRTEVTFLSARPLYSEELSCFVAYTEDDRCKAQAAYCRDITMKGQIALANSLLTNMTGHGTRCSAEFPADSMSYPQWVKYFQAKLPTLRPPSFEDFRHEYNKYFSREDDGDIEIINLGFDDEIFVDEPHGNTWSLRAEPGSTVNASTEQHSTNSANVPVAVNGSSNGGGGGMGGMMSGLRGFLQVGVNTLANWVDERSARRTPGAVQSRSLPARTGPTPSPWMQREQGKRQAWEEANGYGGTMDQPNNHIAPIPTDGPHILRTTVDGVDIAENLGDFTATVDCTTPKDTGNPVDQMSQQFYTRHMTWINNYNMSYESHGGTLIAAIPLDPFQTMPTSIPSSNGIGFATDVSRLEMWAMLFGEWCGDLDYRFHLAAPRETAVRLVFVIAYNDFSPTAPSYQTAITGASVVYDFDQSHRDIVIRVPFVSPHRKLLPFFRDSTFNTTGGLNGRTNTNCMGTLRVYQATSISGNGSSYTNNPLLNLYMCGGQNFQTSRFLGVAGVEPEESSIPFVAEAHSGTTVVAPSRQLNVPSSVGGATAVPMNLRAMASKFAVLNTITVTSSTAPTYSFDHPQQSLIAQADYAQKSMKYFRGTLVVRATPISSGWVAGHYVVVWSPYNRVPRNNTQLTNLDYIILDLAANQPVEMRIPYQYHREFFTVGSTDDYFGTIHVVPLATPLQVPSSGVASCDIEIQVCWEDFESFVPAEIGNSPSEIVVEEAHSSTQDAEIESAAITSQEAVGEVAVAPIATKPFALVSRVVHLSDILKRPYVFLFENASLSDQFIQLSNNWLDPATLLRGSHRWIQSWHRAWRGDQILTFYVDSEQGATWEIILAPTTELSGQSNNTGFDQTKWCGRVGSAPAYNCNDLAAYVGGMRNYGDSAPISVSTARRVRVQIPYHSVNRFTISDPSGLLFLPSADTNVTSETRAHILPTTACTLKVSKQISDCFMLTHFNPPRIRISGFANSVAGTPVLNYPGQYFAIV